MADGTSFCARCGYLLTGTADLFLTGGVIPTAANRTGSGQSPRNRGIKQGLFIFLLTFLVVPLIAIISVALNLEPWAVAISSIVLFVGGLIRMAYALMFESTVPDRPMPEESVTKGVPGSQQHPAVLPPQQSVPVSAYAPPGTGKWRDTNDLQPTSVTESTTQLLEKGQ